MTRSPWLWMVLCVMAVLMALMMVMVRPWPAAAFGG